jgi:hypothetical protein
MLRGVLVSAALLPMLCGCVSQVQLVNDKGQTAQCNAAGLGIVTSVIAAAGQKDCIDRYQNQGYHKAADSNSSAAATSSPTETVAAGAPKSSANGKRQADQCNTYGVGILSSFVAASMQQTCEAGPAASAPASAGQAKQN